MPASTGKYPFKPRIVLKDHQMFKVMMWLENADKDLLMQPNEVLTAKLEAELGFPISAQTVHRLTSGKRKKIKEMLEVQRLQKRAEQMRERALTFASREKSTEDPSKALAVIARAVIRLYEGLGSTVPKELETIAYK